MKKVLHLRNECSFRKAMAIESTIKGEKRGLILYTTLKLVSQCGLHGTSVSMIAEAAGIGAGTIYRYFKNKDELIYELYKEIQYEVIDAMLSGFDEKVSYKEQFETLWMNMTRYYVTHPKEFQYLELHRYSGYMINLTRLANFKILYPVMMFFINAKKNKAIKNLPLYTIVALTQGPIISLSKLHIDHNQKLTETIIREACACCWDSIKYQQEN